MKVSVIICTYSMDRFQDTLEAVNSVLVQSYNNIELIIAVDHNEEVLENFQKALPDFVKFAFNDKTRGLSDTRNAGIKIATGDIVAFIDDDAIADRDWIKLLLNNYTDLNVVAVGGKLIPIWQNTRPLWFPEEIDWIVGCTYRGHPEIRTAIRNLIGCNMSFRRDVMLKTGYFITGIGRRGNILLSGEETEYCLRILSIFIDKQIIYEPKAIVYHKVEKTRESIGYVLNRSFSEGLSKANIKKLVSKSNSCSNERKYLSSLLFSSLPTYILKSFKLRNYRSNILKTLVLIAVVGCTGLGFINATLKTKLGTKNDD